MFTWTSRFGTVSALLLVVTLAGCMGENTAEGNLGFGKSVEPSRVLSRVDLFRGHVVVAGPRGYCIDEQSLRRAPAGAFVLIASCESLTGKPGRIVDPAVMTVSVVRAREGAGIPSVAELAALTGSSGILQENVDNGLTLVQLAQGGDALLPEGDPRHWRGGMLLNGYLVGLAVYGPQGSPVAGGHGRALIMAMAESLRTFSPERDATLR